MKKLLFLAAMAVIGFASCTSDEYLGENSPNASQQTEGAINFGGGAGNITRATQNTGTVAQMLDGHFRVYGVKDVSGYKDVFQNYAVWNSTTKTTSNPDGAEADADNTSAMNGWEYVGDGSAKGGLATQTIKYWDYSATDYHFVAGSPYNCFTFNGASSGITSATVTGIKGHILTNAGTPGTTTYYPVYIANPVKVLPAAYQQEVTFRFTRQQSFVRVGIFENIPGYSITDIKFYTYDTSSSAWETTPKSNIVLASTTADYFQGTVEDGATAILTYDWAAPTYTFAYDATTITRRNVWYGGAFALNSTNTLVTTSTASEKDRFYGTDKDMDATNRYFTVLPSPSDLTATPLLIKCDYTLTADDSKGETINVKGATAAIPAAFTKWMPNTSYTYLFKISDNTNGSTGTPGTDPEGLYPITFDAVVIAETTGTEQGTITSVSTPSITTFQHASVTAAGVKYTAGTAIYITAQNDESGELYTLLSGGSAVGAVQVYSLGTTPKTEADLQLTAPTGSNLFGLGTSAATVDGVSFVANKYGSFTPSAAGYYAIQYQTAVSPAAYAYKVVLVEN